MVSGTTMIIPNKADVHPTVMRLPPECQRASLLSGHELET
jgi:hypothetical protein